MKKKKTIPAIPTFLKNRYAVTIIAFFIWMLFFDRNNIINQYKLISTVNNMEKTKEFYIGEIESDSAALHTLLNDEKVLEKFAREKYLMKRDDEDIFLIIKK